MSTTVNDHPAGSLDVEAAVGSRYSEAARQAEAALCCPVEYDQRLLEAIPSEILERDYGCGDPSRFIQPAETVLDLGSGGGKICYIAAQIVGPEGRIIGVDCNDDMLQLARRYRRQVAEAIGCENVEFRKGRIQDLQLDLELLDEQLRGRPIANCGDWLTLEAQIRDLRQTRPLVADESVDVIVSNCVLNLVRHEDRAQLFREMFRVLKRGGRVVISDIVADEDVAAHHQNNPELWSGCISGAFREDQFLAAFEEAGFYGVELLSRQSEPWAIVEGIEFRSATVRAFKGKEGPCLDRHQAVIYKGPWKAVLDDDGHTLYRGERMAVCEKTYQIYNRAPYSGDIELVPPQRPVPESQAEPFSCSDNARRDPRQTKQGAAPALTLLPEGNNCCGTGKCC